MFRIPDCVLFGDPYKIVRGQVANDSVYYDHSSSYGQQRRNDKEKSKAPSSTYKAS